MLYIKAFHIISMVAWFAGLFYLPRLFVYHVDAKDRESKERFCIMERRLYYAIMYPAACATTVFGLWLITYNKDYYLKVSWMHGKLVLVLILWVFHVFCGYSVRKFAAGHNNHTSRFYRIINELPTLLLISIILLVVVKPG